MRLYQDHQQGLKAFEAYTVANTHIAHVRREDRYMSKVQDYSVHLHREWWRCYDRNIQLEAELAKYGIPSPSPYLESYNRDTPPEDPPTAELWTTKWDREYKGEEYRKWKAAGFIDPDVVLWVESHITKRLLCFFRHIRAILVMFRCTCAS